MTSFAVLLPVYLGDKGEFFLRAIKSATIEQTCPPQQLVIVCDGPVSPEIQEIIAYAASDAGKEIIGDTKLTVVRSEENHGLAHALNLGLTACEYDVVARADADDISCPTRFAKQLPYLEKGYDLVGSAIVEFNDDETQPGLVRKMPQTLSEIQKVVRLRDPFNHPTVVYRASKVAQVGGYVHLQQMEDYWLFARMVHAGMQCMNLAEPLVLYRVGAGAYRRRGGITLLRSEFILQRKLRAIALTSRSDFLKNIVIRCGYRIIPSWLRKILYRTVGKRHWFKEKSPKK